MDGSFVHYDVNVTFMFVSLQSCRRVKMTQVCSRFIIRIDEVKLCPHAEQDSFAYYYTLISSGVQLQE